MAVEERQESDWFSLVRTPRTAFHYVQAVSDVWITTVSPELNQQEANPLSLWESQMVLSSPSLGRYKGMLGDASEGYAFQALEQTHSASSYHIRRNTSLVNSQNIFAGSKFPWQHQ